MVHVFPFEKLTVYHRATAFSIAIYEITKSWPKEHLFGLTSQLQRASLSIPLNIAEGYSRTTKDFQHFLTLSRGSCYECIPIIKIAISMNLITSQQEQTLYTEISEIAQMLSKLRNSLKE